MTHIEIRPALISEIAILLSFEQAIIAAERPFDNTLKGGHINYYDLKALILSKKSEVLVAVTENKIVGSGYAQILAAKKYQKYKEFAYLGFMYVDAVYRGMGINQKIIAKLVDWSKNQNLDEIRLEVYNENKIALNAYLKVGFVPHLVEMRLDLSVNDKT